MSLGVGRRGSKGERMVAFGEVAKGHVVQLPVVAKHLAFTVLGSKVTVLPGRTVEVASKVIITLAAVDHTHDAALLPGKLKSDPQGKLLVKPALSVFPSKVATSSDPLSENRTDVIEGPGLAVPGSMKTRARSDGVDT